MTSWMVWKKQISVINQRQWAYFSLSNSVMSFSISVSALPSSPVSAQLTVHILSPSSSTDLLGVSFPSVLH